MRRVGLGETLRIALMGNDERVSADTALRIGLVSEVVSADELWTRAHEIAATIAAKPPSATQGTVKAIWESLDKPYRAALEQGLIYTRLGNPIGTAELGRSAATVERRTEDPMMAASAAVGASHDVLRLTPDAPRIEYRRPMVVMGAARRRWPSGSARSIGDRRPQVGIMLRNRPVHVAALLGRAAARRHGRRDQPVPRRRAHHAPTSTQLALPRAHRRARRSGDAGATDVANTTVSIPIWRRARMSLPASRRSQRPEPARCRGADADQRDNRTTQTRRPDLRHAGAQRDRPGSRSAPAPTELRRGVAIVNSPLVHIGGVFRVLQCVAEARPFVLLERFELDRWAEAVRAHRPRAVSLVPAALRMVLHSDLPREDLASIRAVTSGTAPLSADDADAFTEKFGIPGADVLCRNRIRRRRGRLDTGRPPEVLAGQTRQRGPRQPRRAAAGGRRRRRPARRRTRSGLLEVKPGTARAVGGLDAHHRHGPHRRRRVPVDPRPRRPGDHPRWLQGHARRRAHRLGEPSRRGGRRGGRATRRPARRNAGGHGGAASTGIDGRRRTGRTTCETDWRATRFPPRSRSSRRSRDAVRQARPGRRPAPFHVPPPCSDHVGESAPSATCCARRPRQRAIIRC